MSRVLSLISCFLLFLTGAAGAQYDQLWTAPDEASGCALVFCDAGNTDADPQLELLYACGCPEYFHCLILLDGLTGSTEWSHPDPNYLFDGRLAASGDPPWPWHGGPQLLDVDADGLDEIIVVYRTSGPPDYWKVSVFDAGVGAVLPSAPTEGESSPGQLRTLPNPSGTQTTIEYAIDQESDMRLSVYNVQGQLIRTLVEAHATPGKYVISWDGMDDHGRRVASGTYFCRLWSKSGARTEKAILLR